MRCRQPELVPSAHLEGGMRRGKEGGPSGRDTCTRGRSHRCTAEASTALPNKYPPTRQQTGNSLSQAPTGDRLPIREATGVYLEVTGTPSRPLLNGDGIHRFVANGNEPQAALKCARGDCASRVRAAVVGTAWMNTEIRRKQS